jgi:hypothetical protein
MAFMFSGCGKKKAPPTPPVTDLTTPATDTTKKDSADIFNEFFDEKKAKAKSAATFSGTFVENGPYVVQVSSVANKAVADEHAAKLQAKGWPSYVAEVSSPTPELPGTYYRVRVGGFNTVGEAKAFGEVVSAEGYQYWADNRSNDNVGVSGSGLGGGASSSYGSGTSSGTSTESGTSGSALGTYSTSTTGSSSTGTESGTATWGSSSTSSTSSSTPASTGTSTSSDAGSSWGSSSSSTTTTSSTAAPADTATSSSTTTSTPSSSGTTTGGTGKTGGSSDWGNEW